MTCPTTLRRGGDEQRGTIILPAVLRLAADENGEPIRSTHPAIETADLPEFPLLSYEEAVEMHGESFSVPGSQPDSRGFRIHVRVPLRDRQETLIIAQSLSQVETAVERASFLVATIGLLATLGASIIAYSLVTRAFRPLLRVEQTAGAIAGGDFSQRVQTTAPAGD